MKVTKVEYIENYKIKVWLSDKKVKIVDLEDQLKHPKGVFIPLQDVDYFKKVTLDHDKISICWPNGADFCPDFLYQIGKHAPQPNRKVSKSLRTFRTRRKPKSSCS